MTIYLSVPSVFIIGCYFRLLSTSCWNWADLNYWVDTFSPRVLEEIFPKYKGILEFSIRAAARTVLTFALNRYVFSLFID